MNGKNGMVLPENMLRVQKMKYEIIIGLRIGSIEPDSLRLFDTIVRQVK
jgi:hypothetical protein